jgi:hypothetical protein
MLEEQPGKDWAQTRYLYRQLSEYGVFVANMRVA